MLTLHAHSIYSILQGTITPDELVQHAKDNNSRFVSLTDINGMYGLIQLARKAEAEKIKPVLGALIDDPSDKKQNAIFLAKNNRGYSLLCKIITSRKLKDDFSLSALILSGLSDLFIISSSLELLQKVKYCPGWHESVFAELIVTEKMKKHTRQLYEFAKQHRLKIVASHPAYFRKPEDYMLYKVVSAIRMNATVHNLDPDDLADEEYCLKSSAEMQAIWKSLPEALWNIEYIAQNCNVDLEFEKRKFPVYSLPEGETSYSYLWKKSFEGLSEKFRPITDNLVKRLHYELDVIKELDFTDYFLIVSDLVDEAKRRRMVTLGRGSAANSLVSYCLGLSQVDPIRNNFYFERFLNKGRLTPPDVDIDFSWKERDEIVKYIFQKYGYDRVAMISTFVTFRARSALRETAKVFGISNEEISSHTKFIPWTSAQNLVDIEKRFPETKGLNFDKEPWKTIISLASRLSGFPRHLSIHPSGLIITPDPITEYVALEYAKNKGLGLIITQPDMYSVEEMGLIKIDLLSQRALGAMRDTLLQLEEKETIHHKDRNESRGKIFKLPV
ncbi:MAG: PHP domain-containing protein [Syntrophothermus sp.]